MITLVVHYRVRPGAVATVLAALRELQGATRAETGCIRYEVTQSVDDPARFLLFEQYADDTALVQHTASEHFLRIVEQRLAPLLEERVRERYVAAG